MASFVTNFNLKEKPQKRRAEVIFEKYIHLVETHFREKRVVEWYADQLFLSSKYLSEAVRKASERTPLEWINMYTALEIRLMLKNTKLDIKEIARLMNFSGIEFDYDAENMVMSTEQAIYFDGARERIYYADYFNALTIYRFVEVPAVPADPSITNFWNYDDYFGNAELDFTLNNTDVDGNYITPDKLSYVVYVDDELFEADAEEYGMEESMSEFPYGFRDPEGYIGRNYFCVFFAPAKNMGLQAIYRGAGEENRSNIVMYDIESGQVNIIKNADTGIEEV